MGIQLVARLAGEFPRFGTNIIIDILFSAQMDEDAARAVLKKIMARRKQKRIRSKLLPC
jgi:hypothetical protein